MSVAIAPVHRSLIGKRRSIRSLDSMPLTDDQRVTVQEVALGVFTAVVNAGRSLQEALAAVYLTGLENGVSASTPTARPQPQGETGQQDQGPTDTPSPV